MRDMSAPDLLSAWEQALRQPPVGRALALLSAANPERSPEELAGLTIGQRNRCLLELRERWFGPELTGVTTCPRCGHAVELGFLVSDLSGESGGAGADDDAPPPAILVDAHGYQVECRLPTSRDLASLAPDGDPVQAEIDLLRRCIGAIEQDGRDGAVDDVSADPASLPAPVVEAIAQSLSAADPLADTSLALACPDCAHAWQAPFDIASYLFTEIHGWARRVLREVHALARAYGWSEADILAMAPVRRRAYLELLEQG